MSLGSPSPSSTLQSAIDYAWSKGIVVVAAAGNSGTDAQHYPAAYGKAIAVGATDNTDAKASYSNYGSSWVDVAAPGSTILSTTVDGSYGWMSGTSMATPHVAGEAGLVWSKSGLCGASDNACVRNQIESKADRISGTGTYWAYGRVNANGGVGGGTSALLPIDSTAPTVSTTSPSDGKTGVGRSINVKAIFSEAIDPGTLSSSTFTLVKSGTTTPISAPVTLSSDGKTGTLNPYGSAKTNLSKCTWYTATLTTGVKDKAGNSLAAEKVWRLKTRGC
jgi:subtilisin family serine protease